MTPVSKVSRAGLTSLRTDFLIAGFQSRLTTTSMGNQNPSALVGRLTTRMKPRLGRQSQCRWTPDDEARSIYLSAILAVRAERPVAEDAPAAVRLDKFHMVPITWYRRRCRTTRSHGGWQLEKSGQVSKRVSTSIRDGGMTAYVQRSSCHGSLMRMLTSLCYQ